MPAAAELGERRKAYGIWELRGASTDIQIKAVETMPLTPKEWLAEFQIDSNWGEFQNDPEAHIKNSRARGYIPFSFANFTFSERSGIITPDPAEPITFYLRPNKWHVDDPDALYKKAQDEITQAIVEGRRPNNIRFNGMNGGFEQYKDLEEGKFVKLKEWKGVEEAEKILEAGKVRFGNK